MIPTTCVKRINVVANVYGTYRICVGNNIAIGLLHVGGVLFSGVGGLYRLIEGVTVAQHQNARLSGTM
jgi:hypothetical protein